MNSYPYAEMMKKTIGNQLADVRGKQFTYDFTVHINNGSQVEGKARGCVDTGKFTISTAVDIICSKSCYVQIGQFVRFKSTKSDTSMSISLYAFTKCVFGWPICDDRQKSANYNSLSN